MQLIVTIPVEAPDGTDESRVAAAINKMLDVGHADAKDTAEDPEWEDDGESAFAASLEIGQPTARGVFVGTPPSSRAPTQ